MSNEKTREYCLVVEGSYFSESEAEHALRDPFIEEWVETTGRYRSHHLDEIVVAQGVVLGLLSVQMVEDGVFEIVSGDENRPLSHSQAKMVAEAVERQGMFDDVRVEPFT
jgi:hypothetical protein